MAKCGRVSPQWLKAVLELAGFAAQLEGAPFQVSSVDGVDAHAHYLIDAHVAHDAGVQIILGKRRFTVNAHGYQFILVGMLESQGLEFVDEVRLNSMDA